MKSACLFVLFALQWLLAPAQCVIEGLVTDADGRPMSQAGVSIKELNRLGATDAAGYFRIGHIPCGEHSLEISHVGYTAQKIRVTCSSDSACFITVSLEKQTVNIREVVIQGESSDRFEIINIPVRTTLVDLKQIQQLPAISASKIFNTMSGVNVSNEFGIFSSSTVVALRGIGGGSQTGTLVVYDGIPLNKSDGGSVNWNLIDRDNIEKIEVIKGPGSALFGSNAMGGVINILSKPPAGGFGARVSISSGTYRTLDARANLHGSFFRDLIYWKAFVSRRVSDGYINTPEEVIQENDSIVVPVFLKEFAAGGLLGFQLNENNGIEVSLNYFDDIRGRGIKIFEDIGSNINRDTWQGFIKYKGIVRKWKIYTNVFGLNERYFRLNEYYSDGEYTLYEVDSRREDYGLRLRAETPVGRYNEITFGGELKTGRVHGADIYYTSTDLIRNRGVMDMYALFVQDRINFGNTKWSLIAGLRFDGAVFHDASFSIEKPSYAIEYLTGFQFEDVAAEHWASLNPKLSLHFQPGENLRLYLSLARGFRAPVLDDLCRSEHTRLGFRVANPSIKPEHIYNVEIGMDKRIAKVVKTALSVYYSSGNDFMYLLSTSDSVNLGYSIAPIYQVSNISRVEIFGLEADISVTIGKSLEAFANYSYNHSAISRFVPNTAADPDLTGKFLPNVPMHQFSAGVFFHCEYFNLSVTGKYTGARWIKDDNTVDQIYLLTDKFDPYFITDFKLWKNVRQFEFSIDFDNVFNVIYINSRLYKSPGRMVVGRISYNFGRRSANQ